MRPLILDAANPINWQHPLNRGLVGWWMAPPGWSGGSRIHDLTGRANGTLTNMDPATDWVGTEYGPALDFDNTDDHVVADSGISSVTLDDSVGFWVSGAFYANTVNSTWKSVVGKMANGASGNRQFWVGLNGNFSTPVNGLCMFTNGAGNGCVGTAALTAGRLYWFCAIHFSATSGNELRVWSRENGWITASAGSVGPTTTGVDADSGVNQVRICKHDNTFPRPLGGRLLYLQMGLGGQAMRNNYTALHNQWQRGFADQLRWLRGRSMVGYTAPAGGVSVPKFYYHYQQQGAA